MVGNTASDLESIKTVYLFLARVFLKEVDSDFLNQMRSKEMSAELKAVGMDFSDADLSEEKLLDQLAAEYAALFISPGSMLPYQSVEEEGRYLADVADRVELFYQKVGFDYRKEYPKLFPDHMGLQLSFMASMIEGGIKALNGNDPEKAREFDLNRKKFFEKFIGAWYASYLEKLLEGTEHFFYRASVEFAIAFLDNEAENLSLIGGE